MREVQIRVPKHVSDRLLAEVRRFAKREAVVFGFSSHAQTAVQYLILIQDFTIPSERAYLPSQRHGARWSGAYMIELLNQALERQLGLFIFHAHGDEGQVRMSADDRNSAIQLLPKFQLIAPDRPHGSLVIGPDSCAGMILMPDADVPTESFSLRLLNDKIITWPLAPATRDERTLFERQPIASNSLFTKTLGDAKVAVAGLSGGGTQVVLQLARLGVGEIIGIDDQCVDRSNLFATPVITWLDVLLRRKKTSIMKRRVWWINRKVKFTGIQARIPAATSLEALKRADIIVGCVNNLHARADLIEIAWRYCIPYVDIGLVVTTDAKSALQPKPLVGIPGNIFTAIPGGPCMWCTEFLTQQKLGGETGGRGRPYLQDVVERDAYVVSFNGSLASQAVSEVLQLLVGYAPKGIPVPYKRFDGFSGTLVECKVSKDPSCSFCQNTLAAGDPIWS